MAAAVATVGLAGAAAGDVILDIDLSIPNRITISATDAFASAEVSGGDFIYFEGFYAGADNPSGGFFGTRLDFENDGSSLTTIDPSLGIEPAADYAYFSRAGGNDPGLNLSDWTTYSTIEFFTDAVAFIGSSTWELEPAFYEAMLAGGDRSGDIYFPAYELADVPGSTVIGQYSVTVLEPGSAMLTDFTYNESTGASEVSIEGSANTAYKLVEADDLDFTTSDPVTLTGATVGSLTGNEVTTDGVGNATVQFNLGTSKASSFIRAETP